MSVSLSKLADAIGKSQRTLRRYCELGLVPDAYQRKSGHWKIRKGRSLAYVAGILLARGLSKRRLRPSAMSVVTVSDFRLRRRDRAFKRFPSVACVRTSLDFWPPEKIYDAVIARRQRQLIAEANAPRWTQPLLFPELAGDGQSEARVDRTSG